MGTLQRQNSVLLDENLRLKAAAEAARHDAALEAQFAQRRPEPEDAARSEQPKPAPEPRGVDLQATRGEFSKASLRKWD